MTVSTAPIHERSTVCALIPHYRCEQWLSQAIESLLGQTRPPERIVVIDDGSPQPPVEVTREHPEVTLLAAEDNGGPYRLIQAVIDATTYDAYLFQDADDWSAADRVEVLLAEGARTGAELVGSHEVRVLVEQGDVVPVRYPADVSAALRERPTSFPLLHPTSIVARSLVERLGGFASGMRFSGDAELLRRAGHVARIVNADHFGYFRRKRPGSLTQGSDTALGSPARLAVQEELADRATDNARRARQGLAPDLTPLRRAEPVALHHVAGPPVDAATAPRARRASPARRARGTGPVFVVGAPRSGHAVLGWALAQHPAFDLLPDARWLGRASADVEARAAETATQAPSSFREVMGSALGELSRPGRDRLVVAGTELVGAAHALASLFPDGRFVHVVRDPWETMAALAASPTDGGTFFTEDQAWRQWVTILETGLLLEEALGSDTVLRIHHHDLVHQPEAAVRRCLEFVGEPFHAACLGPLGGLTAPLPVAQEPAPADLASRLASVTDRLARPQETRSASSDAREQLARRFHLDRSATAHAGSSLVERVRGLVVAAVPEGSTAAVVSRGDPRIVDLPGRVGWHLPQVGGGEYAGHHPADGQAALDGLLDLQALGAGYLVVPAAHLWWLTYYHELRYHLDRAATVVAFHEEVGAVYRLAPGPARQAGDGPGPARFVAVPPLHAVELVG